MLKKVQSFCSLTSRKVLLPKIDLVDLTSIRYSSHNDFNHQQQQQLRYQHQSQAQSLRHSDRPEFPHSRMSLTNEMKFVDPRNFDPIPLFQVLDYKGEFLSKHYEDATDLNLVHRFYREIVRLNQMDLVLNDAQRQGRLSFYMTSFGEEASHFGPAAALKNQDIVFAQYREPGVLLWRGFRLEQFINQCFGNDLDLGRGRQMPIHYGSKELNYVTIKSTLSSQMLHAVGYAYTLRNKDQITLCYFGEGAASEGDAFAALNFASTLNCPIIFLCRNNGYAISTPVREQYSGDGVVVRGIAQGIPSIRVDGNDALACYWATEEARNICISQSRPVLIEAMTYRISHHSTSDDSSVYRNEKEVRSWTKSLHPLLRLEELLKRKEMFDEEEEKKFKNETRKEVVRLVHQNEKIEKPPIREMFTDVYYNDNDDDDGSSLTSNLRDQYEQLKQHLIQYNENYPKNFKKSPKDP